MKRNSAGQLGPDHYQSAVDQGNHATLKRIWWRRVPCLCALVHLLKLTDRGPPAAGAQPRNHPAPDVESPGWFQPCGDDGGTAWQSSLFFCNTFLVSLNREKYYPQKRYLNLLRRLKIPQCNVICCVDALLHSTKPASKIYPSNWCVLLVCEHSNIHTHTHWRLCGNR